MLWSVPRPRERSPCHASPLGAPDAGCIAWRRMRGMVAGTTGMPRRLCGLPLRRAHANPHALRPAFANVTSEARRACCAGAFPNRFGREQQVDTRARHQGNEALDVSPEIDGTPKLE